MSTSQKMDEQILRQPIFVRLGYLIPNPKLLTQTNKNAWRRFFWIHVFRRGQALKSLLFI